MTDCVSCRSHSSTSDHRRSIIQQASRKPSDIPACQSCPESCLYEQQNLATTASTPYKKRKTAPFAAKRSEPSSTFDEHAYREHRRSPIPSSPGTNTPADVNGSSPVPVVVEYSSSSGTTPPQFQTHRDISAEDKRLNEGGYSPSGAFAQVRIGGIRGTMSDHEMGDDDRRGSGLARAASPAKRRAIEMDDSIMSEDQEGPVATIESETDSQQTVHEVTRPSSVLSDAQTISSATTINEQDHKSSAVGLLGTPEIIPSLDDQVARVMTLANSPLEEGARGAIISSKWLDRVLSRTSSGLTDPKYLKNSREGDIGHVDNSDIVADGAFSEPILKDMHGSAYIPIKSEVLLGSDFEIVPYEAWGLIVGWYGTVRGQKPIIRYAHNTAEDSGATNIEYELHPPILTVRKFVVSKSTEQERDATRSAAVELKMKKARESCGQMSPDDALRLVSSRVERYQKFLARAKEHAGIFTTTKVKVLKVTPANDETAPTVAKLLIDQAELDQLGAESRLAEIAAQDQTANDNYNGSSTMLVYDVHSDQTLLLIEQPSKDAPASRKAVYVTKSAKPDSGRTSPAPGMMTRGRTRTNGRTRGTVGLSNLGNTCYMNSALQCIRSVEELAIYFLAGKYKQEINMSNPLGHKGAMATKYADVVKAIYNENASSSFSPNQFKTTLSRCMPTFSGYGQQDSQEFLSFLVDALHEDLNRIEKKPYLENPDSDDARVMDPAYIVELGEVYRKNHRARNDSIAMDLFSGFYKNTMECPTCDKVSVTFDPYSLLTLQLPMSSSFLFSLVFVPRIGTPVKFEMDVDRNYTVRDLKQYIAKQYSNVDPSRLWMTEVYSHKLYKLFADSVVLSDSRITARDYIFVFELEYTPTCPVSVISVPSIDSDQAEVFTIPINHRLVKSNNVASAVLHPQYISLTREEAKDIDIIKKKVLIAVSQFTSRPILTEPYASGEDSEANEAHVSDHSDPSDEDYVNVSIDATRKAETTREIPAGFMDPDYKLNDRLDTMLYRLGWAKSHEGAHCASLNSYDNNVRPLLSRVKVASRRSSIASSTTEMSSTDAMQEDTDSVDGSAQTPPATESPESLPEPTTDEPAVSQEDSKRDIGKGNKFKGGQTGNRSRAAQKRAEKRAIKAARQAKHKPVTQAPAASLDDSPFYIQLGETIVVDWSLESYDELFKGNPEDSNDLRGHWLSSETGAELEAKEDEVVAEKRARREYRKKHGITLEDCFSETGKREKLSEDNAWYCNRCKELRQATKTLEIWTLPDILVLHLKRFGGNRRFNDKIDLLVNYPVEGLDLNQKVGLTEDGKDYIYDLFAVDNHYGGLGGGHYTAEAKNFFDGSWYDYNDSSCTRRGEAPRQSAAAYLLFYRRRSDKPLGPPDLQELVRKFRDPGEDPEGTESGEEQLDAPFSILHGSSGNSLVAGVTAKTDLAQTASAGGSFGQVGPLQRTNKSPRTNDDEAISMSDDDTAMAYGPALPTTRVLHNPNPLPWSFDNLQDTDNESTTAEIDRDDIDEGFQGESAWNDTETILQIGTQHIEETPMSEDDSTIDV